MSKARLSSWKEIATYLKCDESTARRWRNDRALPVYSVGNRGSSVHAFTDELDDWIRSGKRDLANAESGQQSTEAAKSIDTTEQPASSINENGLNLGSGGSTPQSSPSPSFNSRPMMSQNSRYLMAVIAGLAVICFVLGVALLKRRSNSSPREQSAVFKELGAGQSLIDIKKINNSAAIDHNEEEIAIHLKTLVKETQIWEMLTLYPSPSNCDARDIQRLWLVGSKAFNDVGESVARLNERGLHYGYDSRLLDFQFRYVRIAPDGTSATVGTREHWWLPLYTRDEKLSPNRNPDQGPYEIEYLLTKVNGFWYVKSTSTPYMQWRPKEMTCRNWPQSTADSGDR